MLFGEQGVQVKLSESVPVSPPVDLGPVLRGNQSPTLREDVLHGGVLDGELLDLELELPVEHNQSVVGDEHRARLEVHCESLDHVALLVEGAHLIPGVHVQAPALAVSAAHVDHIGSVGQGRHSEVHLEVGLADVEH